MSSRTQKGRFGRSLVLLGVVFGASLAASAAFAGECPADQKKPNATAPVDYKPVGVTDTVIAMIDVEKEPAHIKDRKFNNGPNTPFGQGDTPIVETLRLIRDQKWNIQATIEFEYKVPPGSDRNTELMRAVKFCKDALV